MVLSTIRVDVGTERLLSVESGIAISEEPNFRRSFAKPGPVSVTLARATDSRLFRAHME